MAFRAGFATFITALALHSFAPAAISVSTTYIGVPTLNEMGNFIGSVSYNINCQEQSGSNYSQCPLSTGSSTTDLLGTVLDMEQLFASTYVFAVEPTTCFAGFPPAEYAANGSTLSYSTDAVCWHHQCSWAEGATNLVPGDFSIDAWVIPLAPNVTFATDTSVREAATVLQRALKSDPFSYRWICPGAWRC
jgi:hypothetical protein